MANKINIRLILELTEKGTSGRTIGECEEKSVKIIPSMIE